MLWRSYQQAVMESQKALKFQCVRMKAVYIMVIRAVNRHGVVPQVDKCDLGAHIFGAPEGSFHNSTVVRMLTQTTCECKNPRFPFHLFQPPLTPIQPPSESS